MIAEYARSEGRWRHAPRIRQHYGYRTYTDPGVGFRLNRFLYALCWTGSDRPSALFNRAVAWLLEAKILLPGLSVLERAVAKVRTHANARLYKLLIGTMTLEQRARLDGLIAAPKDARQSLLDRLRDGPYIQSSREIRRALDRLEEIRTLTNGLPSIDRLPPGKVTALARFTKAAKAQAVSRLPPDRRAATLLAFIRTVEASAGDDVIDLFDVVATSMFSEASTAAKQARLRSLRDLDAAALKLRDAVVVILDRETPDGTVRTAVFQLIDSDALAEPHDDTYFREIGKHSRKIAYTAGLLASLDLGAAPAGRLLLEAIEYLRVIHSAPYRNCQACARLKDQARARP